MMVPPPTSLNQQPEAFGEASMAYIDMSVDGHTVRALLDSGARISVRECRCCGRGLSVSVR